MITGFATLSRLLAILLAMLATALIFSSVGAQSTAPPEFGSPPIAARISVSAPDDQGIVAVSGTAGAVFAGAQVAVRNLYTGETVYTQAGITGTFEAKLYGPGLTPFWISPAASIPLQIRNQPGSLPGGPGTIVYGARSGADQASAEPITTLLIDGNLDDWQAYSAAALRSDAAQTFYALVNRESLYLGFDAQNIPEEYLTMSLEFTLEGARYALQVDPRMEEQTATWQRLTPNPADLGTVGAAAAQGQAVELRLPLEPLRNILGAAVDTASLERVRFLGVEEAELWVSVIAQPILLSEEMDGVFLPQPLSDADAIRFNFAGTLAQDSQIWNADGRINKLDFAPGDHLRLQMFVTLNAPEMPEDLSGLSMIGQIWLQPVVGADGRQVSGGLGSNNGWTAVLTTGGVPIDNLRSDFLLGEMIVPAPQVLRRDGRAFFALDFNIILPDDLPAGRYVPLFRGYGRVGDGEIFPWEGSSLLGTGTGEPHPAVNRLPLVLNVGQLETARLVWSLFHDETSGGGRGLLSSEDRLYSSLSNRVRLNSPTFILPPFVNRSEEPALYPLEPYLAVQMPNAYRYSAAPLLPLAFPGRLTVRVTRPDGTVDDLGSFSIEQNQLSTELDDEADLFGMQSQVDVYRLTTLDPRLSAYRFEDYGEYQIAIDGSIRDIWGNGYAGGGDYALLIAEPMALMPAVMPGTPFEVGDTLNVGVHLLPGAPAEVTVTVRIYPLDGAAVVEQTVTGQANAYGYFQPDDDVLIETAGEYSIEYEARYTDAEGKLWAASLRSAGVIAEPGGSFIAHGRRGLNGVEAPWHPAWFSTLRYGPDDDQPLDMNLPYHSGDILRYVDLRDTRVRAGIEIQDMGGIYQSWLRQRLPLYRSADGLSINQLAARDSLPVFSLSAENERYSLGLEPERIENRAYTYLTAARPGVVVRQFAAGAEDGGLPLYWTTDDPANGQIGAGPAGEAPGDYVFLYGGAVVRNEALDLAETAIYAALGVVMESPPASVFPPYRGEAGGPDGGPLLLVRQAPIDMFFHPTGVQPGQVLTQGDTLAVAGQIAPPLASRVLVTVTDPQGQVRAYYEGAANAVGYFYDPTARVRVDIPGIWKVGISVHHDGLSSAGIVQPPLPQGGVPGIESGIFPVYVVPQNVEPLDWNDDRIDLAIPGAVPYNFNFSVPQDWAGVTIDHVVSIPGYVVSAGPIRATGSSFSFQYNPTNLSRDFPMIETDARIDGPAASDPVTLTFVATGTDANGQFQIQTRTFTIFHDRLMTLQ